MPERSDDFDGYRKWLGIANKKRAPTHYELLAISLDEDDPDVIRAASEQRRHYVESKRGEGHDAIVTEILYRIDEAEATLLNEEMRRDYDRAMSLFEQRQKSRQVDPLAVRSRIKSRPGRAIGEDPGIVKTFAGIMAVVCVGFGIMAWFSFRLPWSKVENPAEPPPVVRGPVELPTEPPKAAVAEQTEPVQAQAADPIKPVMGAADKANATFLVTLPRIDLRVHQNEWWWSDKGMLDLGPREGADIRKPLMFDGKHSAHGIYMAARNSEEVWVTYRLDGRFDSFKSEAVVPEMLPQQGNPRTPLVFKVTGDGKTLWRSTPLAHKGDHQPCDVPVKGVNELSLRIECKGPENWALAAWVEPQLYALGTGAKMPVAPIKANTPPKSPDPHRLLSGHTKGVYQLVVSPDGKHVASASDDRTVRLWELESGKQVWKTNWGNSRFRALAFESGKNRIWAANDSAVCVIDRDSGTTQEAFSLKGKEQNAVAFGKNGLLLATCFGGKTRIYNTAQKKEVKTLGGGGSAVAFNHDATIVSLGGWEDAGDLQTLRINDGKEGGKFAGLKDRTMALQVSPDDKYVAATSGCAKNKQVAPSNTIMVWEAATGRIVMSKPVEEGWCYGLAFSADGSLLAAGGCGKDTDWGGYSTPHNNKLRVWRIKEGKELHAFTGHTAVIQSLVFTPNGKNIVSGSEDSTIRIWSIESSRSSEDRDVTEWVLGKGGKVKIAIGAADPIEVQAKGQLPSGDFALVTVDLFNIKEITDQDLRRLGDLKNLSVLTVMGTSVTDAGLKELANLATLTSLNVAGTTVNGSGFQYLSKLDKLENVLCGGAPITDANLVHLKKLPNLKKLGLVGTPVTDAGIPTLASLKGLLELRLNDTKVSDKGLAPLKSLKNLEKLSLSGSGVSKKGVDSIRAALPKCEIKPD